MLVAGMRDPGRGDWRLAMMRILLSLVLATFCVGPALAQAEKDENPKFAEPGRTRPALLQEGVLTRIKGPLEQIFQFSLDGVKLKLDRKAWSESPKNAVKGPVVFASNASPIENIFRQIQAVAGAGGSSTTMSNRYREMRFFGNALVGRVLTRDSVVHFGLEETGAPHRTLEFHDDGQGAFRLLLSGPADDILIKQAKDGAFTVAAVVSGKTLAAQAPSFLALYKQHHETLDRDILPVLDGLSIRLFTPPSSAELRSAVRALLLRSPATLEEGKKLLADLDNDRFAVREKATVNLDERYQIYKDLIAAKLKEPGLTIETERRLQKIVAAHPDAQKTSQVIDALGLLSDSKFLVGLLEESPVAERPAIAARLEEVSGQRHGSDVAAWKEWLAGSKR
jgi:hypothetical protein